MADGSKKNSKPRTKKPASSQRNASQKPENNSNVLNDILLLMGIALVLLMMISVFGFGGIVGNAFSGILFGMVGYLAYIFPILLFLAFAFLLSNKRNALAYKKLTAAVIFFVFLCGLIQIFSEEFVPSMSLMDYYSISSDYKMGGGLIGGAICFSTAQAFGIVGGIIIMILVLLVCLIIMTQRSFFGFLSGIGDRIIAAFEDRQELMEETQPEQILKEELQKQQRQNAIEKRRAKRVRKLEAQIAREEKIARRNSRDNDRIFSDTWLRGASSAESKVRISDEESAHTETESLAMHEIFSEDSAEEAISAAPKKSRRSSSKKDRSESQFSKESFDFDLKESPPEPVTFEDTFEIKGMTAKASSQAEIIPQTDSVSQEESVPERTSHTKQPKSSQAEIQEGVDHVAQEIAAKEEAPAPAYIFPSIDLMKKGSGRTSGDSEEHLRKTAQKLQETLYNFGVNVKILNVSCGPTVTRYELQPEMGVKVSKIVSLTDDIKLNLACADIRIEAPIPGKAAIGIEVPNKENVAVPLRDLLESAEFKNAKSKLSFAAGKDIAGKPVVTDIAKMPHLLIAGATGSGKSVCINTLIISLLYKASPDEVKLIMVDPKVVELSVYNGIPHLLIPVVTDPKKAAGALNWAVQEMTSRYNTFAEYNVRNLGEYNRKIQKMVIPEGQERPKPLPQIVIIVDELADLMMVAPGEVEDAICRLAQLARAAGIHLIIATQRPSVNVITGLIKANMPSRIAFSVSSGVDSRTILDMNGAEKLLGKGDMLFYPQGLPKPARLQGAFISDEEVSNIVNFLKDKNPKSASQLEEENAVQITSVSGASGGGSDELDVYFTEAGKFIIEKDKASIGMLQRMFKIGFNRAARIMDQLSDAGVVGPEEGTKPRKILMSEEQFENYLEQHG